MVLLLDSIVKQKLIYFGIEEVSEKISFGNLS